MPLLDPEQIEELRNAPPTTCTKCHQQVRKNYCRQCDEFFQQGHTDGCSYVRPGGLDAHIGHRTY